MGSRFIIVFSEVEKDGVVIAVVEFFRLVYKGFFYGLVFVEDNYSFGV